MFIIGTTLMYSAVVKKTHSYTDVNKNDFRVNTPNQKQGDNFKKITQVTSKSVENYIYTIVTSLHYKQNLYYHGTKQKMEEQDCKYKITKKEIVNTRVVALSTLFLNLKSCFCLR